MSLVVLQMKVVGGRKMGITQCILKKKAKKIIDHSQIELQEYGQTAALKHF